MLASVFDLASDTLKYEEAALRQFVRLIDQTVEARVAATLLTLMEQKRSGAFGLDGLERGVGAFRAVLSHLRSDEAWADETEVFSTGIRLQIVDDLLDYKKDLKRGQLNFLQNNRQRGYLEDIIKWDYQRRFHNSVYPLVLFAAVKRAQHVAQISLSGIESKTENLDRVGSF
ncbi:MAG: hypothetical protein JO001_14210 [Alphaproteobacteria bacterium]|nr:hypothetical protein [Alphaproteobacteria bacterium]